jgi:antitoxin VapB
MIDFALKLNINSYILIVYSRGCNMNIGSVFENNRTQAVRLPVETRFPKNIKKVTVRVVGDTRIIAPLNKSWDDFFLSHEDGVSEDFLTERASQNQSERESL